MTSTFASYLHRPAMAPSQPPYQNPYSSQEYSEEFPPTSQPFSSSALFSDPYNPMSYGATAGGFTSAPDQPWASLNATHSPDHYGGPPRLSPPSESTLHSGPSSVVPSPTFPPHIHPMGQQPITTTGWPLSHLGPSTSNDHVPFFSSQADEIDKSFINPSYLHTSSYNALTMPDNYPDLITPNSNLSTNVIAESIMAMNSPSIYPTPPSPFPQPHAYNSYSNPNPSPDARRLSTSSSISMHSSYPNSDVENVPQGPGRCPREGCGRMFKDLRAHLFTHGPVRPEKCPLDSCAYHKKGFARKYDRNRHTLTHYKGTMICGFCDDAGTHMEKSFNRADVFKRHLISQHKVEAAAPNSRRKPDVLSSKRTSTYEGKTPEPCSTCAEMFADPQIFYEHLDECVLKVVQKQEPSEAINKIHLNGVKEDPDVQETMEKHHLSTSDDYLVPDHDVEDEEDDADESMEEDDINDSSYGSRNPRSGKGAIKTNLKVPGGTGGGSNWNSSNRVHKKRRTAGPGLTYSTGGVRLNPMTTNGGRKKRKDCPPSWGSPLEKMTMRKRVLCVFDGERRLLKDDMMLNSRYEVGIHMPLTGAADSQMPSSGSYITDLDFQTLRRADGVFNSTSEERGPWVPDNVLAVDPIEDLLP